MTVRTGKDFSRCNPRLELEEGVVMSGDLESDLYIDHGNLEEEFLNQPEKYAWWGATAEIAKDLVARQKFLLERLAAILDHHIRTGAVTESVPGKAVRLTEKQIEHSINSNEDYQKAMFSYLDLKKQLGLLQAGKDAIEQRKDMLISLGANYRAEASSNPSIMMDAARERARRAAERKQGPGKKPA